MKKHVLFIHGAGEGAYDEDKKLADSLQKALGDDYNVVCPQMPNGDNPEYAAWKAHIDKTLSSLDNADRVIFAGHSLGASVLLKYLTEAEASIRESIVGIFLIAAPYWGAKDWEFEGFALREGFADKLPIETPIHLYHSRDDEWVPFSHLALYREKLPQASVREFDGRGHQFNDDLSQVAVDITNLTIL